MAHGNSSDEVVCYDQKVLKNDDNISWFGIKEGTDALSKIPNLLHGMLKKMVCSIRLIHWFVCEIVCLFVFHTFWVTGISQCSGYN
jgi:hypothetical protein